MVNEERIKLMTRMAAYEKEGHKKNKLIVSFFKSDYISMQMLKSVISSTIAFIIMFVLYVLYDFEFTAYSNGVKPLISVISGEAFNSRRKRQISVKPSDDAICKAVTLQIPPITLILPLIGDNGEVA